MQPVSRMRSRLCSSTGRRGGRCAPAFRTSVLAWARRVLLTASPNWRPGCYGGRPVFQHTGTRIREAVIQSLGGIALNGLMGTVRSELVAGARVESELADVGVAAIYVLWHGRLLPCAYRYRGRGFATVITRNRDGERIAGLVERWGYQVIRGSSSSGSTTVLRQMVRFLRSGVSVAVTPDGPRGPRQKMKLGPLLAARITGVPLIPVAAGASAAWYFGRWDRFLVPRPFAWSPCAIGEPVTIPADATERDLHEFGHTLERALNTLTAQVDEVAGARR